MLASLKQPVGSVVDRNGDSASQIKARLNSLAPAFQFNKTAAEGRLTKTLHHCHRVSKTVPAASSLPSSLQLVFQQNHYRFQTLLNESLQLGRSDKLADQHEVNKILSRNQCSILPKAAPATTFYQGPSQQPVQQASSYNQQIQPPAIYSSVPICFIAPSSYVHFGNASTMTNKYAHQTPSPTIASNSVGPSSNTTQSSLSVEAPPPSNNYYYLYYYYTVQVIYNPASTAFNSSATGPSKDKPWVIQHDSFPLTKR